MIETEVKFHLGTETVAREVVASAGLTWKTGILEVNRIFDSPDRQFRAQGSVVRLRTRGELAWLTFKQKTVGSQGRAKARIEHETRVSDAAATAEVLEALGLAEVMRYDKYRASYRLDDSIFEIDRLPGGWFCEVEAEPEFIDQACQRCGIVGLLPVDLTYPELCFKLFTDNIIQSPCWIFPESGEPEIELPEPGDAWWFAAPKTT